MHHNGFCLPDAQSPYDCTFSTDGNFLAFTVSTSHAYPSARHTYGAAVTGQHVFPPCKQCTVTVKFGPRVCCEVLMLRFPNQTGP
jgi:hypothetical protein